jgi:hypothetical protein
VTDTTTTSQSLSKPTLAEDVMLSLFDPSSGTIAGEGTLFYVLGGAVLAELAQDGLLELTGTAGLTGAHVKAVGAVAPADPLFEDAWARVSEKPRGVQGLLATIGPRLRSIVLDRLIARGDIREEQARMWGLIPTTKLEVGPTGRRDDLVARLRAALVDGEEPDPRTAALAGLLSASNSLPSLHREIPWSARVHDRAKALEHGEWGASAAGEAVQRTIAAIIAGSVVAATTAATTTNT